ncbi:protein O-mannosyl-transferase family [Elusimicrobiota bacterium]
MRNNKFIFAFIALVAVLMLYVMTCCRTVPPYRDSGELITASSTLSIAHSPAYPIYIVTGKLFISILGILGINPAFSMNLFSAFTACLAVFLIVLLVHYITGNAAVSVYSALLSGLAYTSWYLAVVAEMYSFNMMFTVMLLYAAARKKYLFFAFILGLALGNHLTVLLAAAPMVIYVLINDYKKLDYIKLICCFLAGFSVYVYLPVRASADPFINWGDPSDLISFWKVLSRSAYGHTLDLVSREVSHSQVFFPYVKILANTILRDISWPAAILSIIGFFSIFKNNTKCNKRFLIMLFVIFITTGPVFLYMAKMPVNPHAKAIVEVGYIIPIFIICVFSGLGFMMVVTYIRKNILKYVSYTLLFLIIPVNIIRTYENVDKSANFLAREYAYNILNSLREDSAVIMRKDHTMFSLWYLKNIMDVRRDVKVISKGLISAAWYRKKLRADYAQVKWPKDYISDEAFIEQFYDNYADKHDIYMTPASAGELGEKFFKKYDLIPYGLVLKISPKGSAYDMDSINEFIEDKYMSVKNYRTDLYYDFFSRDIIIEYSDFYIKLGVQYYRSGMIDKAKNMYRKALRLYPGSYRAYSNLAYSYLAQNRLEESIKLYRKGIEFLESDMGGYTRKTYMKKELAQMYNNLGAVYERLLRKYPDDKYFSKALSFYNMAIELFPEYSQAYYNKGVLYWGKREWNKVLANFKAALDYDPQNLQIKKYIIAAKKNLPKHE